MRDNGTSAIEEKLVMLRMRAELEAETSANQIETDLGSALLDVCAALGLAPEATRRVVGWPTWEMFHGEGRDPHKERVRAAFARSANVWIVGDPQPKEVEPCLLASERKQRQQNESESR